MKLLKLFFQKSHVNSLNPPNADGVAAAEGGAGAAGEAAAAAAAGRRTAGAHDVVRDQASVEITTGAFSHCQGAASSLPDPILTTEAL